MKTYFLTAVSAAVLAGCTYQATAQQDKANPSLTTKSYDLPAFTGLDVATGIEVDFETGTAQSVVIANKNGAWDKIEVSVKDDMLHLKRKTTGMLGYKRNKEKYKVTVTAPTLSYLETSSGSSVRGSGLSGDSVTVDTSSGSEVKVTQVSAGDIIVDTSSGSSVTLSGTCAAISADTSSGSSVRGKDLVCTSADLEASSGSSVSITATTSVRADASSGSSVNVSGNPANRDVDRSSGASVNIRG